MENNEDHPVYARTILDFLTAANDYCYNVEQSPTKNPGAFLGYLQKILPLLYIKGSLLPDLEVTDPALTERIVTEEQWQDTFNILRMKFLTNDEFWFPENLETGKHEPKKLSLSELIADIYQDLKDFVVLYQKNSVLAKENAVNDVKDLFISNWGYKTIKALVRVHDLFIEKNKRDDYTHLFN